MSASIVVACSIVRAIVVFLRPVQLEIRKPFLIEPTKEAQHVWIEMQIPQIALMLFQRPGLVPSFRDTGIVLPLIEETEMIGVGPVHHLK
jgi:hypothetical protein